MGPGFALLRRMTKDYKDTVFLPQTEFPMRGGLAAKEPELLKEWQEADLYGQLRKASAGHPKFIFHDGPPYANGSIHMGHALGKVLRDLCVRAQQMSGRDAPFIPGFDCHGLPIEWKIEEKYRAAGKNKDEVPVLEFRAECRAFAAHWVGIQSAEFQRLGVVADWKNPYLTMSKQAEASIAREIHKFLMNGSLYRGVRPVMWSTVEKTALAEAEVEYKDYKSATIWVKFPVVHGKWRDASVVIWTTTPWTIPANRAVAAGKDIEYGLYEVEAVAEKAGVTIGERLVIGCSLAEATLQKAGATAFRLAETAKGAELRGTVLAHPLRGQGFEFDVRLLEGDFVTEDAGTGFVHIAPEHGADDFHLGKANGVEITSSMDDDGAYRKNVPLFAGKTVYTPDGKPGEANGAVIKALAEVGKLLAKGSLLHSYPHSWRSKAPVIFRTTPQWFISMEANDLRQTALEAIDQTRWIPQQAVNRIRSMVEGRPDWCISRQRTWGVPIAFFVDAETDEPLRDEAVLARIVDLFEREGSDSWYARPSEDFLGSAYDAAKYRKVMDIVDVWFESGSTHSFVLEGRPELDWPADLYLEGSDQHRGWFQSSLLESCGTRGRAPFRTVLTHGFLLDDKGYKMSKSLGNVISPDSIWNREGADILRLWAVTADYFQDIGIGPEILKQTGELYRRLRNTLRYLLGALAGFTPAEAVEPAEMPALERWVLHRLWSLDKERREAFEAYDFPTMTERLHHFAALDLSAFYFDIRKDSLYCDAPGDTRRRAVRTVMSHLFDCLVKWLAPVLCFTTEEAWKAAGHTVSVHLQQFPQVPDAWRDDRLAAEWERLRAIRGVVTGAVEIERAEKRIGASLQAEAELFVESAEDFEWLKDYDFPLDTLAIISGLTVTQAAAPAGSFILPDVKGIAAVIRPARGDKCERCWRVLPEVGRNAGGEPLCERCLEAAGQAQQAAE